MQLMPGLTSLTYCEIVSPSTSIDLKPLKELAGLQELLIDSGDFTPDELNHWAVCRDSFTRQLWAQQLCDIIKKAVCLCE